MLQHLKVLAKVISVFFVMFYIGLNRELMLFLFFPVVEIALHEKWNNSRIDYKHVPSTLYLIFLDMIVKRNILLNLGEINPLEETLIQFRKGGQINA
jgi:hypothetical protein